MAKADGAVARTGKHAVETAQKRTASSSLSSASLDVYNQDLLCFGTIGG